MHLCMYFSNLYIQYGAWTHNQHQDWHTLPTETGKYPKKHAFYVHKKKPRLYFTVLYETILPNLRNWKTIILNNMTPFNDNEVKLWSRTSEGAGELPSILTPAKLSNQFLFLPSSIPCWLCIGPSCAVPIWVTQPGDQWATAASPLLEGPHMPAECIAQSRILPSPEYQRTATVVLLFLGFRL